KSASPSDLYHCQPSSSCSSVNVWPNVEPYSVNCDSKQNSSNSSKRLERRTYPRRFRFVAISYLVGRPGRSCSFVPVSYIAFDLLYSSHHPNVSLPLEQRRALLERLVRRHAHEQLIFSEGFVGQGVALFGEICRRGLEGVVAKRLGSPYRPGSRSGA